MLDFKPLVDAASTLDGRPIGGIDGDALKKFVELAAKASLSQEEAQWPTFSLALEGEEPRNDLWSRRIEFEFNGGDVNATPTRLAKLAGVSGATTDPILLKAGSSGELEFVGIIRRPRWLQESRDPVYPRAFIATVFGPANFSVEGEGTPVVYTRGGEIGDLPIGLPYDDRFVKIISRCVEVDPGAKIDDGVWSVLERILAGMVFGKKGGAICITDENLSVSKKVRKALSPLDKMKDFESALSSSLQETRDIDATTSEMISAENQFLDSVTDIVRMTTIDGATFLSPRLQPVAFGHKLPIEIADGSKCYELKAGDVKNPFNSESKGTRHKSSVAWVAEKPDAPRLAIVVSQDGDAMIVGADENCCIFTYRFRPRLLGWHRNPKS